MIQDEFKDSFRRALDEFEPAKKSLYGQKGPLPSLDTDPDSDSESDSSKEQDTSPLVLGNGRYIETKARVAQSSRASFREAFKFATSNLDDPITSFMFVSTRIKLKINEIAGRKETPDKKSRISDIRLKEAIIPFGTAYSKFFEDPKNLMDFLELPFKKQQCLIRSALHVPSVMCDFVFVLI